MTTIRYDDRKLALILSDLPKLTGSDKQVAWAETIRAGLFGNQIADRFAAMLAKATDDKRDAMISGTVAKLNANLAPLFDRQASAKFWIENQNKDLIVLARG